MALRGAKRLGCANRATGGILVQAEKGGTQDTHRYTQEAVGVALTYPEFAVVRQGDKSKNGRRFGPSATGWGICQFRLHSALPSSQASRRLGRFGV